MATSYALNLALTVAITIAFLTEGTMYTVTGPVLLDLAHIVRRTAGTFAWTFVARGLGLGISSFVRGFIIPPEKHRAWVALGFFTLEGVVTAAMPWCSIFPLMVVVFFLQGALIGYTETDINDLCVQIWGSRHGPYLQMVYLGAAFGGLLAPFMALPFVKATEEINPSQSNITLTNQSFGANPQGQVIQGGHASFDKYSFTFLGLDFGPIQVLHSIIGVMCLAVGLLLAVLAHVVYKRGPYTHVEDHVVTTEEPKIRKKWVRHLILFLLSCSMFNTIGSGVTYASFLTAFVVKQLGETKEFGTWVTTVFGGCGVVGSTLAIFLTFKLPPNVVILFNLAVPCIGAVFLTIFGSWSIIVVWAGSCALAFGGAASYAGTFVWAGQYLPLSIQVSSVLVSASTFGELGYPVILGPLFDRHPMVLTYITLAGLIANCILYVVIETIARRYLEQSEPSEDDDLRGPLIDRRMYSDDH